MVTTETVERVFSFDTRRDAERCYGRFRARYDEPFDRDRWVFGMYLDTVRLRWPDHRSGRATWDVVVGLLDYRKGDER